MASYDQKFLTGNKARSMLSDVYHEFSLVYAKIDTKADKDHTHYYAGSATVGGSANSAVKLDTATAGAANKPVYFTGGKPAAISYTIDKSVPSNAEFTDYKVTQNNTTASENYRIIFSANSNDSDETTTVRKSAKFLANPSTGVLTATTFKGALSGNADSASKLTSGTVGATNRPVYFQDGVPTLCAYTIGASVPGDAEFTDTWRPVVDALNSTETEYSLSANQGRVLKGLIDGKSDSGHGHLYAGSASDGGPAKSATKLATERTIFGHTFDGTKNVEGQAKVYGSYTATTSNRYGLGGLQILENGLVGSAQSDIGYAPSIGFHWQNRTAATLLYHSDGNFYLRKQDGTTRASLDANIIGNVTGNLSGNATSATSAASATNDSAGQKISETYIKALSVNGQVVTYTRGDNTTGTITTQDTKYTHPTGAGYNHIPAGGSSNQVLRWKSSGVAEWSDDKGTTYTAGSGISISGTTINNSGVRSITTGSTNGTISVNMNGTASDVAVKGLGSAAYTASSAYAAVSHDHSSLFGVAKGTTGIDTAMRAGRIEYDFDINTGVANLFPAINNANSLLAMNRHSSSTDMYQSQLGFSSNGNIYYRYTNGESLGSTTTWKQIAFTDSIASASSADKLSTGTTGSTTQPVYFNDGVPTAITANIGSVDVPIYMSNGTITASTKKFSDYLPLSGGTITGGLNFTGSGTARTTFINHNGMHIKADTGGWANGLNWNKSNGSGLTSIGAYGSADNLNYLYFGGTYDDPYLKILPDRSVVATKFVGALDGNATTATTASKLSTGTVGSTSQPVYFNNGVPTVCTEISAGGDASKALADLQSFLTEVT